MVVVEVSVSEDVTEGTDADAGERNQPQTVAMVSLDGTKTSSARSDNTDSNTIAFPVRTAHCSIAVYSRSVNVI